MKLIKTALQLALFMLFFSIHAAHANPPPVIHFTDLITGPDTGIGDGLGNGVIVTIWGQGLGANQGSNTILFTDSTGKKREAAHVYYWKNADGLLPSGPAKLYESHNMQEIAFSIPDSAQGIGAISLRVNGVASNSLPFTIRSGNIYHVMASGNDSSNGSFKKPFLTVAKGDSVGQAGDTLYIHSVTTGGPTEKRAIYNNQAFKATTANQFAYVAYPNTRPTVYGANGIHYYLTTGLVTSKLSVYSSNCDAKGDNCFDKSANGIMPGDYGRVIGNLVTDQPNGCANSQAGAISGGVNRVNGAKIFGNYIYEYSCREAGKLHHTTYMTIRGAPDDPMIEAWEWGWNYLKDNHAKNGIHNYDEDNSKKDACGDMSTDLLIHDNVIVNQAGSAIVIASQCGWTQDTHIYNNVIINAGLQSDINCTFNCGQNGSALRIIDGGLHGTVHIYNNTMHTWDVENTPDAGTSSSCISVAGRGDNVTIKYNNNVCYTKLDKYFIGYNLRAENKLDNFTGSNNAWYYSGKNPINAKIPEWDTNPIIGNPLLTIFGSQITTKENSPLIGASTITVGLDIYGNVRPNITAAAGAVEPSTDVVSSPKPKKPGSPSNIQIELYITKKK